jgi:hypothetical protein
MIGNEYVRIHELDRKYLSHDDTILVTYACSSMKIIGFELALEDDDYPDKDLIVYRLKWKCPIKSRSRFEGFKRVQVKLPLALRYRPDLLQRNYYPHTLIKIRCWMLSWVEFERLVYLNAKNEMFKRALVRVEIRAKMKAPFSRPSMLDLMSCLNGAQLTNELVYKRELNEIYQCKFEQGELKKELIED